MIELKCSTADKAKLTDMTPFQGDLKKRTEQDLIDLAESLQNDGLLMPFALWQVPDQSILYILDGHGRMQALVKMALKDATILEQEFPVLLIRAETEDEARKILLQITSTYGKFQKNAVVKFAAPIINYKAPVLVKAQKTTIKREVQEDIQSMVVVRLRVPEDKVKQLTAILKQVDGLEVI